jgi:hypothetical protein
MPIVSEIRMQEIEQIQQFERHNLALQDPKAFDLLLLVAASRFIAATEPGVYFFFISATGLLPVSLQRNRFDSGVLGRCGGVPVPARPGRRGGSTRTSWAGTAVLTFDLQK